MEQIVASILYTPDGTKLQSYHHHDYKTHTDRNGKTYMLDGGLDYVRCSAHGDEKLMTITTDSPFTTIRRHFHWGTRGKDGKQPLTWKPLNSLDSDHIEAILDTQSHVPKYLQDIFRRELDFRGIPT